MCHQIRSIEDAEAILDDGWDRRNCIFRGQPKEDPLIPKIGRRPYGQPIERLERQIVNRLKKGYQEMHQSGEIHSDFTVPPDDLFDWDWHVLAQHHGLPTRLLDWSAEIKVALYFAVVDNNDCERSSDGALYVFQDPTAVMRRKTGWKGICNVRRYRAYTHPYFDYVRVKRQKGELTFQPNPQKDLFEQLGHDKRQKWQKFAIPVSAKATLKEELQQQRITYSSLFPGLDGLCHQIRSDLQL